MGPASPLLEQIYPIEQAVAHLLQSDRYAGAAGRLLRQLQQAITHLRATLEASPADEQRSEELTGQFYLVQELLTYLQGSEESRGPQLVAHAMQRSFLQGADLPILLHTTPFHSRFSRGNLAPMLTILHAGLPADALTPLGMPPVFPTIAFPAIEQENALAYAILAFEYGAVLQQELPDELLGDIPGLASLHNAWQETLLADAWATRLAGPAYALAAALLYPMMEDPTPFAPEELPPVAIRFACISALLRTYEYDNVHEAAGMMTRVQQIGALYVPPDEFVALAQGIAHAITRADGPAPFTAKRYLQEVPPLLTRLHHLVPPNEMETPAGMAQADVAAILNAGWAMALDEWEAFTRQYHVHSPLDAYHARVLLSRLVLKGVELSLIADEWEGDA